MYFKKMKKENDFKIFVQKMKTIAFQGKYSVLRKFVQYGIPVEWITSFKHLDCEVIYKYGQDSRELNYQNFSNYVNKRNTDKQNKERYISTKWKWPRNLLSGHI